ncbi:hypothetical protein RBB50_012851 [Rhinocladiella similis]
MNIVPSVIYALASGFSCITSPENWLLLLPETAWRQAHTPLAERNFTKDLLAVVKETFNKHETNWQGTNAVRLMGVLAQRLLSLSPHEDIRIECLAFLKQIRHTTLTWARELDGLFARTNDHAERSNTSRRLVAAANVTLITFDAEASHYSSVLESSSDVAEYCECLILLNNHAPLQQVRAFDTTRSERLKVARAHELLLHKLIATNAEGLNAAARKVWSGFYPHGSWLPLQSELRQWLEMCISADGERVARTIHFNTLSGELLIDGIPLSRLPSTVSEHKTFERLFGKQILDVAPSSMPGMQFMSKLDICGHQVRFRLDGADLIIRSKKSGVVQELIPTSRLEGAFPHFMIHEYFHWFDLGSKHVEWKPRTETIIPEYWCSLQTLMSASNREEHRYPIMFLLATMAYTPQSDPVLLETLLAFSTVAELTSMKPPQFLMFDLKDGCEPQRSRLGEFIKSSAFGFYASPQLALPKLLYENKKQHTARRQKLYDQALNGVVDSIIDHLCENTKFRHR